MQAAASTAGESGGAAPQRAERALSMESAASASLSTAAIPKGTQHSIALNVCTSTYTCTLASTCTCPRTLSPVLTVTGTGTDGHVAPLPGPSPHFPDPKCVHLPCIAHILLLQHSTFSLLDIFE